jgi:predicted RNase H-like nuclease (RuvC/YqgF family)
MGATKKEIADELGGAKQTIVNYIERLGLQDHLTRVGKADVLDDYAVSAIADAVGKNIPQTNMNVVPKEDGITTSDAVVTALNARISDLKEQNESLSQTIRDRDREIEALRDQLAEANDRSAKLADRVAGIAERQQVIAATPWWRRGKMALKLLGPGSD